MILPHPESIPEEARHDHRRATRVLRRPLRGTPSLPLEPMDGMTVRLSSEQITQIRRAAAEGFGPEARVWLFGSRVDDCKLGGDIDLLVESDWDLPVQTLLRTQARMEYALRLPVDLVVQTPHHQPGPIAKIARMTGVRLA